MSNKLRIWDEHMQIQDESAPEKKPFILTTKPEEKIPNRNEDERGGWSNKLDFLMSCISLSVGLGNVWRFPYLCYKNGGGTFLITYHVAMFLCGIPLFFQEVTIGQYLGSGGMTFVGQLCPILKGVGFATMTIVFLLDVYYCVIIAWTLFYFYSSITSELPWSDCGNWWNSKDCYNKSNLTSINGSYIMNSTNISQLHSPVEEFFDRRVLSITSGLTEIGSIQWNIFIALCVGWILVYCIIRKGLHQSGKVIWFTALFPYVILMIMLFRAVTLEGAGTGLLYYITPQWKALLTPGPWMDGASQIFFAYSIGCGALPALGSFNKFHHNCYRDAIITCIVNTLTSVLAGIVTFSILGHLALEQKTDVSNVVNSGPGLVFITYPQVVLKLPGSSFWAALFFIMLLLLGIDSEFCLVESFITGIVDNWPQRLRPYRNACTAVVCAIMFLLGVPMVTQGGMYIFKLMDHYAASGICLLWVCFFQTIAISWFFGVEKLCDCIEKMMGMRPGIFLVVCWKYIAPLVMTVIFVSQCFEYESLKYGDYKYPIWADILGLCISFSSMLWIPVYAIYYILTQPGSLLQVIFVSQCFEYESLKYGDYKYPIWADILGLCISFSSMLWIPVYAIYYILTQPGSLLQNIKKGVRSNLVQRKISICDKSSETLITQSNVVLITPNTSVLKVDS